ncbi:isoprenyl transferase [Vibrio rumoiensis]|uniref:Ditrans,polycis-undecaprenyl-diphosphate synthase ((2E,6E)-farnesyl-diphosphate specific) n=1 Tax=Vibrio rumoiensis 1S-45 TaxID=1188252 RepID=A0A1E5E0G0_9VIBR|nr:isoprenyl transferase [Vibrio rumoiensis]OEF23944.1 di-trans,poly-cis-decaprenylcistransferase [Vibrio rumoiensis 1S-45]
MPNSQFSSDFLPQHIAVIMDGNGRWAKKQGKPRLYGHRMAVKSVRETISTASRLGIKAITLFAFSSENWKRPEEEVNLLMDLFITVLTREVKKLHKNNLKLRIIGDKTRFGQVLQQKIAAAEELTKENTGTVINIAANYGGKWDITEAVKKVAAQVADGELTPEQIGENTISQHLSMADLPDVDLMIRTSGECRISNFMLWQMAYAELYFTELFWPEFNEQALLDAITWFINRERRFGCTSEQLQSLMKQK